MLQADAALAEDEEAEQMDAGDEVAEEGQEVEQEEEEDELRSSVPVLTPKKKRIRAPLGTMTPVYNQRTPPRKAEKKPAAEMRPKREPSASPVKAGGSRLNRYATGGNASGRRPWTTVEDNALMAALQEIHQAGSTSMKWRTVLQWHGPAGTKSTLLENRNNAQLKDRARNLFNKYSKSGQNPPEWLPEH